MFPKTRHALGNRPFGRYIFLPPRHIPLPRFDVQVPNEVHQADLLFLPHDQPGRGRKLYKYALTVVDIASRYKEAEPLAKKEAKE